MAAAGACIAWFLPTLAALMGALASVAVAHALITAARRRRHELAVLKAIGFQPSQVRATLAWKASTLAFVGIVVGLPAGVVLGRLAWSLVAHRIGVAPTVALPALALVVPATLLLVNAVAYLPARAAARTRTSVALAAE